MKLREIERLRAVAILLVMVVHWPTLARMLPAPMRDGWSGVDLFFVISGYVVSLSLLRALPPLEGEPSFGPALDRATDVLRVFYVRRFFRILPPALTVMLAYRVLADFIPQKFGPADTWWSEVVSFFGGIYNYTHPYRRDLKLGVYWSLAVEEHFYLFLPVLFVVFRTRAGRVRACVAIGVASAVARALSEPDAGVVVREYYFRLESHLRFDSLMAGVVLALLRGAAPSTRRAPRWVLRWVVVPAALAGIACLPTQLPQAVLDRFGYVALWAMAAVVVGLAGRDEGLVLEVPGLARALEYVGSRSYALYLVHQGVGRFEDVVRHWLPAYERAVPDGPYPVVRVLVVASASFALAELLHRGVERPCMALGKRLVAAPGSDLAISPRGRVALALGAAGVALVSARHAIVTALGPPDLARGAAVTASSWMTDKPPPSALTNGVLEPRFGLHTEHQDAPWAIVDLGAVQPVGAVRIYNREDGYQDDDLPLSLELSEDGEQYREVGRRTVTFTQEVPWRVATPGARARYVRLRAERHTALCLSEVEVYASPAMAAWP